MPGPLEPPPFHASLIAPCGMNCGVCRAYLRERNPCHGCREAEQNVPKSRVACRMRLCEARSGRFCHECAAFPCERLQRLDRRYRARYGMSELENLECIRDRGLETFLERERRRWVSDEGVLCVHDRKRYPLTGNGGRNPKATPAPAAARARGGSPRSPG